MVFDEFENVINIFPIHLYGGGGEEKCHLNIKTMIICYAKEEDPDIVNSITGPIYYVPVENKINHLIRIS